MDEIEFAYGVYAIVGDERVPWDGPLTLADAVKLAEYRGTQTGEEFAVGLLDADWDASGDGHISFEDAIRDDDEDEYETDYERLYGSYDVLYEDTPDDDFEYFHAQFDNEE
jgi:hypothetical protein